MRKALFYCGLVDSSRQGVIGSFHQQCLRCITMVAIFIEVSNSKIFSGASHSLCHWQT